MADSLDLVYLIEGTSDLSSTSISYSSTVDALRKDIFEDCREDGLSHRNLSILKVYHISALGLITRLMSLRSTWMLTMLGTTCPYYDSTKMKRGWKSYLRGE